MIRALWVLFLVAPASWLLVGCEKRPAGQPSAPTSRPAVARTTTTRAAATRPVARARRDYKVVHVFVALADNQNQGIVKVTPALGNGQDPGGNLYWGAMYGVKTFFSRSPHWRALRTERSADAGDPVLERAVLKSAGAPPVYVIAEAYDGAQMKAALTDFLDAAAGTSAVGFRVPDPAGAFFLHAGGQADMVCFVGHNGLMDIQLDWQPRGREPNVSHAVALASEGQPGFVAPLIPPRVAVVLACKSQPYFTEPLRKAHCLPLLTTTGLMAPEAYTLDAIIRSWAAGDSQDTILSKAAEAYAKYQKCPLPAARKLFTGAAE